MRTPKRPRPRARPRPGPSFPSSPAASPATSCVEINQWVSLSENYCGDLREPPRHRADSVLGTTSRRWHRIFTPSSRRNPQLRRRVDGVGRLKFDFHHTGDEAQDEATEAQENDDESRRRALDQAWYERRLAPLMARADGAKAPVVNDAAVARVGVDDDGGVDIAAARRRGSGRTKKRRRRPPPCCRSTTTCRTTTSTRRSGTSRGIRCLGSRRASSLY